MPSIPDSHVDLLIRPSPAVLATVMPDGRPQASVVWVDYTDEILTLNTERGRRKTKNTEIAQELFISLGTVKSHLSSLQDKIGARNRVELAAFAWQTARMRDERTN